MNFLHDDRLAFVYSAAFGCTSFQVAFLILFDDSLINLNVHRLVYPWIQTFLWLFLTFLVTIKYYPLFAVIRCHRILIEPLIGLFYTGYVSGTFIYQLTTFLSNKTAFIVPYIPPLVCHTVLIAYFLVKSIQHLCIKLGFTDSKSDQVAEHCSSQHQRKYVKWLFNKSNFITNDATGCQRSCRNYITQLKERPGLMSPHRASPRVICTFLVAANIIFEIGTLIVLLYTIVTLRLSKFLESFNTPALLLHETTLFTVINVGFYISFSISSLIMPVYMFLIFVNYRRDLEKMQRGDYSFLPMKLRKSLNENLVAASLRYSGSQIAYLVWCYILIFVVLFIGCVATAYIVILPLTGKVPFFFFEPVLVFLPIAIVNLVFRKLIVVISGKYFLQDHTISIGDKTQKALALNNTKIFNILSFLVFFFNCIIGFISCISRIMIGLAIGLISLARINKCMLPRGFEEHDKGYSTYVGMIMVDLYHRNPIFTVFCEELLNTQKTKSCTNILLSDTTHGYMKETASEKHRRICRRWQKARTLLCNPSLVHLITKANAECAVEQVQVEIC